MFRYIIYRIGQFLVLHFPLKLSYAVAVLISDIRYIFTRRDRISIGRNLRIIFPNKTDSEIRRITRNIFRNFLKYLVDFLRFSKIDKDYINRTVRLENIHYLDEALKRGKGAIALTAHIGNWELGGVVVALLGYPFYVVVFEHKHKKVNDFFMRQRNSKGIKAILMKRAARQALDVLKRNRLLGLAGDIDFGGKMYTTEFFGRKAYLPRGPAALAIKTGAVIVPGFMIRNKDDSFSLRIEKPIEFFSSGDEEQDLSVLISSYKSILEDYVKKYPEQWYMFREFAVE